MDYKTYVRFVYSHAEGDGCHDHIDFFHQELVLVFGSGLRVESCMVRQSLDAIDVEQFCEFFDLLSAEAVYDA